MQDDKQPNHKGQNSLSRYSDFLPNRVKESAFLYKKTERLVVATYMVSDLMPLAEPLRLAVRGQALHLLEDNMDLVYSNLEAEKKIVLNNLSADVLELVALLEAGKLSGLISVSNTELLKDEFFGFLDALKNYVERPALPMFSSDFFDVSEAVMGTTEATSSSSAVVPRPTESSVVRSVQKDNFTPKARAKSGHLDTGAGKVKKDNRRSSIVALLKRNKELSIKDFSNVIKDCSEKTIQRELNDMLEEGVLKRVGERRWSKYSLA